MKKKNKHRGSKNVAENPYDVIQNLWWEEVKQSEKELYRALRVLQKHNVVAVETSNGERVSVGYLLGLEHRWDNLD